VAVAKSKIAFTRQRSLVRNRYRPQIVHRTPRENPPLTRRDGRVECAFRRRLTSGQPGPTISVRAADALGVGSGTRVSETRVRSVRAPSAGRLPRRRGLTTQGVHRLVFWGAVAVALVPFVVSAVTVFVDGRGYHSFEDNALTELNVRDVGHHAVELGVFNRFGWHHLGPAVFYVLAPLYRALGSRSFGLLIGALILNAAAVVGIALVARRRGGIGFALAALAGTTIVSHSLGPSFLRSPWPASPRRRVAPRREWSPRANRVEVAPSTVDPATEFACRGAQAPSRQVSRHRR
jgi:hypothetical protein